MARLPVVSADMVPAEFRAAFEEVTTPAGGSITGGPGSFTINSPEDPAERGGTLAVDLADDEDGAAFVQALAARDVLVDHRPEMGLRVSPHFYTTSEELSAFAEHMSELRSIGGWRAHQNEAAVY